MNAKGKDGISRRALLTSAAGIAGVLILQPGSANAAGRGSKAEKMPERAETYTDAISRAGYTDLDGIHAEYLTAVAAFPFALPDGSSFPAKSRLSNIIEGNSKMSSNVVWERGGGYAEAYLFWQSSVISAAFESSVARDSVGTSQLLDTLARGYDSDTRRAVLDDPDELFLKVEVAAARAGDFSGLASYRVS